MRYPGKAFGTTGGFPEPVLKNNKKFVLRWQQNFISNYIQRDLPALGFPAEPDKAHRLLQMLASANGGPLNFSELARSLGISVPSAKTYFGFFENAFLVHRLKPWSTNLKKRIVKTPRLYFSDTGMLHYLLGVSSHSALIGHIGAGASWENFVINQVKSVLSPDDECFYHRTQDGSEIDLLVRRNNQWLFGAEIKLSNAPKITRGNYLAMSDINLPKLHIITPEADNYLLKENVEVHSLRGFMDKLIQWGRY
ncbi:MAG: DUF4143 domain-containing protein [Owenweeksia sp.]|nr:DUF4143 domain-containing protein [Owenweeksia sp.]